MSSDSNVPEKPVEEGAPDWVVTFGDLMSLLLCFFVLLLSFSETDKAVYKEVAGSMANAFGVQRKERVMDSPMGMKIIAKDFNQHIFSPFQREEVIATQLKEEIGEELKDGHHADINEIKDLIKVETGDNSVTIRMMGESTFDSGKAYVRPEIVKMLQKIASVLKKTEGDIIIAGHTDNVPIKRGGLYKSNLALSMARAASVVEILLNQAHVQPKRISTMGFGEYRPMESNDSPEGRKRNRRVEITLQLKKSQI
ncbi:MAG: OmpA family protein [Desulfosarcina sp.]|nr:OmpA family protein [Desulfobacterales bacterium]